MVNWLCFEDSLSKFALSLLLCISTSERMLVHAFAWSKTIKNIWKCTFFIMCTRGSCKMHEEKWSLLVSDWERLPKAGWHLMFSENVLHRTHERSCRKNNKIPNEQPAFGCQPAFDSLSQLLTWLTYNFFLRFSSWALHEPLIHMMKKVLFSWFLNVCACVRWSKFTTDCRYSLAQMCTREDTLAHYLGTPFIDDTIHT